MSKASRGFGQRQPPSRVRLRAAAPDDLDAIPPPLPIYHHPVVALSLILTVAALFQIAAWRLWLELGSPPGPSASRALVHGFLYDRGADALSRRGNAAGMALAFPIGLGLTMLSSCAWFATARLSLGPRWGLWVALAWVTHPVFAIVGSRAGPLGMTILLTSLTALAQCWWRYRGNPWPAAVATGILAALLALNTTAGALFFPLALTLILVAQASNRRRALGGVLCFAGFAAVLALTLWAARGQTQELRVRIRTDLSTALASAPGWEDVRAQTQPATAPAVAATEHPLRRFASAVAREPVATARWYAARVMRTVYATADRRFERPLVALQLLWAVPAVWGTAIAVRYRPWRWLVALAACFAGTFWLAAALFEPLARNLTPVGGFGIMLGLIGCADVYERFFGRRLLA